MSKILDAYGRPIDLAKMREEQAAVSVMSIRQPAYQSVASALDPQRLAAIVRGVDENDGLSYLTLAEEMEERDLHYRSVLGTRKMACASVDPEVEAVSDDPADVEIADFVREVLLAEPAQQLRIDLLDGLGKGYSICEISWDQSGERWTPKEFVWRDQRHFKFDQTTWRQLRLIDQQDMVNGVELAPFKFLVHLPKLKSGLPLRGGLARLAMVAYMCKTFTVKSWMTFCEVYGMPLRLGRFGESATTEQKAQLLRAVANLGSDAAAIIPESMKIEFTQTSGGAGGGPLFSGLAEYLDKQVSKGVLGQTMTSDDGSSRAQALVHDGVRSDILTYDGRQLASTLSRDLVRPLVDLNFGPRAAHLYPRVKIAVKLKEDLESLARALPVFIDRGLTVEVSVIRDKFGLPEPAAGAEVLKAATPGPGFGGGGGEEPADEKPVVETKTVKKPVVPKPDDEEVETAAAHDHADDEITRLAQAKLKRWKRTLAASLDPIRELARNAETPEAFVKGLHAQRPDLDEVAKTLAVLMFEAHVDGGSITAHLAANNNHDERGRFTTSDTVGTKQDVVAVAPTVSMDPSEIVPRNEVEPDRTYKRLIKSMRRGGWKGDPILAYKDGDEEVEALTGSHRLEAAKDLGMNVPVKIMIRDHAHETPEVAKAWEAMKEATRDGDTNDTIAEHVAKIGDHEATALMNAERDKIYDDKGSVW
jgi:phage gp29-like protein